MRAADALRVGKFSGAAIHTALLHAPHGVVITGANAGWLGAIEPGHTYHRRNVVDGQESQ